MNDVIDRCHSAGLIELWLNKMITIKNKPAEESEPIPLTMDHLTVGFVVRCKQFF